MTFAFYATVTTIVLIVIDIIVLDFNNNNKIVGVKITKSCRTMLEVVGQASQTHHHSFAGEVLPHFDVKKHFASSKTEKVTTI